jgi:hypothetical protein
MTTDRSPEYLVSLVHELRKLPKETEWVEFKQNYAEQQEIGEYLSPDAPPKLRKYIPFWAS